MMARPTLLSATMILLSSTFLSATFTLGATTIPQHQPSQHQPSPKTIEVTASAVEYAPADQIQFSITISEEDETAEQAYNKHLRSEQFLVEQIRSLGIRTDQIRYEPVRIRPFSQRDGTERVRTDQMVIVTLEDLEIYASLQKELITHGFQMFTASFSSTRVDGVTKTALQKAVKRAGDLGAVMAESAGMVLGEILSIHYGRPAESPYERSSDALMAMDSSSGSLREFEQTIPVRQTVTIVYALHDSE